jgi:hypothetical protein
MKPWRSLTVMIALFFCIVVVSKRGRSQTQNLITNPSFEQPQTSSATTTIQGWISSGNNQIISFPQAPDGSQVLRLCGTVIQTITTTELGTYTIAFNTGFFDTIDRQFYFVEIYAGNRQLHDILQLPPRNVFFTVEQSFPSRSVDVGKPLEIRVTRMSKSLAIKCCMSGQKQLWRSLVSGHRRAYNSSIFYVRRCLPFPC